MIRSTLYLCEKPSQARDIAAVLGIRGRRDGYIETDSGNVTWALGHLLRLPDPDEADPNLKIWTMATIPFPVPPKKIPRDDVKGHLKIIKSLIETASDIVIATDPDREGELIAREILTHFGYKGPLRRLWLSALDVKSIRNALSTIRNGTETENLAKAAAARQNSDWINGMNLTRAATIRFSTREEGVLSIGRVQTPTIALVVRRDRLVEGFSKTVYYEIEADMASGSTHFKLLHSPEEEERILDSSEAERIARERIGATSVLTVETTRKRAKAPRPFSLTTLQKKANALFGWGAKKTLQVAQSLYETHQAASYARTDCEYLPNEQEGDVPAILAISRKVIPEISSLDLRLAKPSKHIFDTSKLSAHHAIIPTTQPPDLSRMSDDEKGLLRLIHSWYVACLFPDHVYDTTKVTATLLGKAFSASSSVTADPGWKVVLDLFKVSKTDDEEEEAPAFPYLVDGTSSRADALKAIAKETKPPKRYTEASLIEDMKSIAKYVTDPAHKAKLKETSGIGTVATQAQIIETIKERGYVETKGKALVSTPKSRRLVAILEEKCPELADPCATAIWETEMEAIAEGSKDMSQFERGVATNVARLVEIIKNSARAPATSTSHSTPGSQTTVPAASSAIGDCPLCGAPVIERKLSFSCAKNTKENSQCQFFFWKNVFDRDITTNQAGKLIAKGKIKMARTSRAGKSFEAEYVLVKKEREGRTYWQAEPIRKQTSTKAE